MAKKENNLAKVLLHEKPVRALVMLRSKVKNGNWYASLLAKKIDCTYPHMIKLLGEFQDTGLVSEQHKGRMNILRLTDKGETLAKALETALKQIEKA